jgi:hypothetical protein
MVSYCFVAGFSSPVHKFLNVFLALFPLSFGIGGEAGLPGFFNGNIPYCLPNYSNYSMPNPNYSIIIPPEKMS